MLSAHHPQKFSLTRNLRRRPTNIRHYRTTTHLGDKVSLAARRGKNWSLAILAALLGFFLASGAYAFDWSSFPPANFTIYDVSGKQVIGHASYRVEQTGGFYVIRGENHYLDGEYDIETERLSPGSGKATPRMLYFSHVFYNKGGSKRLLGELDVKSGLGTCATYGPKGRKLTARLQCPSDTSAGAALLIPIMDALKRGRTSPLQLHVFDCTPGPKVLAVTVRPNTKTHHWPLYPGRLVQIEVAPNLGWWNLLLGPFLPKVRAWFDPSQNWDYVGGIIHHYFYRGPKVALVKKPVQPGQTETRSASSRDVNRFAKNASELSRATAAQSRKEPAAQPPANGAAQK